jgi:signal peptidase II
VASSNNTKAKRFWPVLLTVLLLDCSTKRLAVEVLSPPDVPHDILGDVFRLTLAYNRGAATGIMNRGDSRWLLTAAALVVIAILWRAYRRTEPAETTRIIALALLTGGAIGNVIDRVRWTRGVVDFVDLGVGTLRFWTRGSAASRCGVPPLDWSVGQSSAAPSSNVAVAAGELLLAWVLQHRPEGAIQVERERPGAPT